MFSSLHTSISLASREKKMTGKNLHCSAVVKRRWKKRDKILAL
jgi:hypothetical protein